MALFLIGLWCSQWEFPLNAWILKQTDSRPQWQTAVSAPHLRRFSHYMCCSDTAEVIDGSALSLFACSWHDWSCIIPHLFHLISVCVNNRSDSSVWTLYVLIKCRTPTFLFNWSITYCEKECERSQLTFPDMTPPLQRVTHVLFLSSIWHYDSALRKTFSPADGS